MKSKIEIEYPFTEKYDCAYRVSSQGRNTVVLYKTKTRERTSISYAKYLMSIYLKRWLSKNEHVDHINNNKIDDRIENYQILSLAENNKKQASVKGCKVVEYKCPICGVNFSVRRNISHFVAGEKTMTCSKKCGGKSKNFDKPIQIVIREYDWYKENHWSKPIKKSRYIHS